VSRLLFVLRLWWAWRRAPELAFGAFLNVALSERYWRDFDPWVSDTTLLLAARAFRT